MLIASLPVRFHRGFRSLILLAMTTFSALTGMSSHLFAEDAALTPSDKLGWSVASPIQGTIGFAGPYVGVSGDRLIVAGGANFPDGPPWEGHPKIWHEAVYALKTPQGKWEQIGTLPRPLGYGISVNWQGGIVCAGGSDAHGHSAETFLLKLEEGTLRFTPLPDMPTPLAMGSGALVGSTLYIAGGQESPIATRASSAFYALNLAEPSRGWQTLESWPGPSRMLGVAGSLEEDFFLFSGAELVETPDGKVTRRFLKDAWRYRAGEGWSKLPDLPHSVVAAPSPALPISHNELLILGGDDGALFQIAGTLKERHPGFSRTPLIYQATSKSWGIGPAVPLKLSPSGADLKQEIAVPTPVTTGTTQWGPNRFAIPSGEAQPGIRTPSVLLLDVHGNDPPPRG